MIDFKYLKSLKIIIFIIYLKFDNYSWKVHIFIKNLNIQNSIN